MASYIHLLVEKLGNGYFGEVHKARENNKEEFFALKKIIPKPGEPINTLMEEMNILKSLDHKNIIKFIDAGIDGNSIACLAEGSQLRIESEIFLHTYGSEWNYAKDH
ncbi:hypothetical protein B4U80_12270 [Leptotrombidium deliense]|uniref:Protein kinase domain-containing protein n=1 Tax=Leptotrombidium deliense TaxID=299467 RepID=A0A443RWY6_9ACAR|nr:hypothetical protein B4U80_12270 [Leptotrombidium deliense]